MEVAVLTWIVTWVFITLYLVVMIHDHHIIRIFLVIPIEDVDSVIVTVTECSYELRFSWQQNRFKF